jgi:hypothetical protein
MSGSVAAVSWYQSKVGRGLRPSPLKLPVIAAKLTLSGAIQVIQLK